MRPVPVLLIGTAVVAGMLALLLTSSEWGLGSRPWLDGEVRTRWQYLLEDVHDRSVYQQRGRWLAAGVAPYLGEHSEYPELATWMLGLPYVFIDHHVPEGGYDQTRDPGGKRRVAPTERAHLAADRDAYFDRFHMMMAVGLLWLLGVTVANLRTLGASAGWALLLLLPTSLYFGFNRYDVVPAAMVSTALLLHLRGRVRPAALVLGLAAMMKWYPILLLPMFCAQGVRARRDAGAPWKSALLSGLLIPGLLAGGVCVSVLAVTFIWDGGGLDAVSHVYRFHGARNPNLSSLVASLTDPGRLALFDLRDRAHLAAVFTLVQFLPAALLALLPVRSRDGMLLGCLTVVAGFVTFSKIFSPQWILWVTALAVLAVPRRPLLAVLLVALELLTYLQIPVLHYGGPAEVDGLPAMMQPLAAMVTVCDVRIVVLVLFWAWSLLAFLRTVMGRSPSVADTAPST